MGVALNVAVHDDAARSLYRRVGFADENVRMGRTSAADLEDVVRRDVFRRMAALQCAPTCLPRVVTTDRSDLVAGACVATLVLARRAMGPPQDICSQLVVADARLLRSSPSMARSRSALARVLGVALTMVAAMQSATRNVRLSALAVATALGCGGSVERAGESVDAADAATETEFNLDSGAADTTAAAVRDEGVVEEFFDGGTACGAEIRRDLVRQVCCEGAVCRGDCYRVSATAGECRCFDEVGGCPEGTVCCARSGGCTSEGKCSK
ncbi:MAG: hypothetical protein HYV09_26825 [Deltaproteobacteria bacterium]|nr:hypothetical protein [Deltaproteobacteria bacterium]